MDQMPNQHNQVVHAPEVYSPGVNHEEVTKKYSETAKETPRGEMIAQAVSAVSQAQDDNTQVVQSDNVQPLNAQTVTVQSTNPQIADDVDVIEKEWVMKAKEIVSKTKDDPHAQSNQMMVFRHDYMKKRYGKEIKLPNEQVA